MRFSLTKNQRAEIIGLVIALAFLLVCVWMTKSRAEAWNDISRMAAIESLATRGTWVIDDSPWTDLTQDKIFLNGHFYSDKMPLLSFAGAGLYQILHTFTSASLTPNCTSNQTCAYYWLALTLIGLPTTLSLWLFYRYALRWNIPTRLAVLVTLALGFGTMLWPYSLVFNHQVPAACCLFASFYLLTTRREKLTRAVLAGAGLFAALAISLDALAGIMAASILGIVLWRARGRTIYFVLGMLLPLALTTWLDYQIAQTVIPPYLLTYGYDYPSSVFPATIAGNGTPDNVVQYAFKMLVGAQGLFAYEPILFFALGGIVYAALKNTRGLRTEALCIGSGFIVLTLYLIFSTGNLGGVAYGERWFISALPLTMAFVLFVGPFTTSRFQIILGASFCFLLVLSILSSYQGTLHPWLYSQPPMQLTRSPSIGFRWNLKFPLR